MIASPPLARLENALGATTRATGHAHGGTCTFTKIGEDSVRGDFSRTGFMAVR